MADQNFTTQELESEEWCDVVGYEGLYSVSTQGRIRGLVTNTILKPCRNKKTGYYSVSPSRNGKRTKILVHHIVAAAFLGPRPKGLTVNHKNGDKSRNEKDNLEYATYQRNVQHAFDNGLAPSGDKHYTRTQPERHARGERSAKSALTEQQVRDIRTKFASGSSYTSLSIHYGVTSNSIGNIVRRKTWDHVK